jgi:hypothetical protein
VQAPSKIWVGLLVGAVALYLLARYTDTGQAAVAGIADTVGSVLSNTGKHGIRNNNPGNIVRNSIAWQGLLNQQQVEAMGLTYDPKFCQFDTPANGIRAIGHVLLSYQARGIATCTEIIYGAGNEGGYSATDQAAYAAHLTEAVGLDPNNGGQDTVIDIGSNLPALATAIITQENGEQPYALSDIANWVYS